MFKKEPVWVSNLLAVVANVLLTGGLVSTSDVSAVKAGGFSAVLVVVQLISTVVARSKVRPVVKTINVIPPPNPPLTNTNSSLL